MLVNDDGNAVTMTLISVRDIYRGTGQEMIRRNAAPMGFHAWFGGW